MHLNTPCSLDVSFGSKDQCTFAVVPTAVVCNAEPVIIKFLFVFPAVITVIKV